MSRARTYSAVFAVALAVVVTVFAWPASAESPPGPAQDRVYGGGFVPAGSCTDGPDTFCTGVNREFSIFAASSPQGRGAYGMVRVGVFVARVTCLAVHGSAAEIGGVLVDSADPSDVGDVFRLFVRDSGGPGAARDGLSAGYLDLPPAQATCTDLDSDALGAGYFTVAYGDLVVEDR